MDSATQAGPSCSTSWKDSTSTTTRSQDVVDVVAEEPTRRTSTGTSKGSTRNAFRLQCKSLLLTYSQTKLTKEEVQSKLQQVGNVEKMVIGLEHHQDGNLHIHAGVVYQKKLDSYNSRLFDLKGEHPNIQKIKQGLKNLRNSFNYCKKEDPNPLVIGFSWDELESTKSQRKCTEIVKLIKEGASLKRLREEQPEWMLLHGDKAKRFKRELELDAQQGILKDWIQPTCSISAIQDWLASVVKKPLYPRQHRNLWINARTGVGKTRLISQLKERLRVYDLPTRMLLEGYEDGMYDLIVIDEYSSSWTIEYINKIADGAQYWFDQKYTGGIVKKDCLPVLVCSNGPPSKYYKKVAEENPDKLDALEDRFDIIFVDQEIILTFPEEDTEVVE